MKRVVLKVLRVPRVLSVIEVSEAYMRLLVSLSIVLLFSTLGTLAHFSAL
jgi:hypothetical protein